MDDEITRDVDVSLLTPVQEKHARMPLKRIVAFIITAGIFITSLLFYSLITGQRMSKRYTPVIEAAMKIKLEATTGYLWFEEVLLKDHAENMTNVKSHFAQADWYAKAMLEGGSNTKSTLIALDDAKLRGHIEDLRLRLDSFSKLIDLRWQAHNMSKPEISYNGEFKQAFMELIVQADHVETRLQNLLIKEQATFKNTHIILALMVVVTTLIVCYLFVGYGRMQNKNLNELQLEVEDRKKAEEILRLQATTDHLTGLHNRRHLTEVLQDEALRTKRQRNPYSVVLFDIDYFKSINDTHGHDTGDLVLQAVATITVAHLREVDVLARWGGEEFLMLLRDTDLNGATQVAEKSRAVLAAYDFGDAEQVTASFGVVQYLEGESIRDLVHRADEALYSAKAAGRNKVCVG
ncbi:MAG: GGDEF domain-containing protein [Magnetovibrio sp.]|nr:GGDEF domain-containing protein [Magnetovibrio sp.]